MGGGIERPGTLTSFVDTISYLILFGSVAYILIYIYTYTNIYIYICIHIKFNFIYTNCNMIIIESFFKSYLS